MKNLKINLDSILNFIFALCALSFLGNGAALISGMIAYAQADSEYTEIITNVATKPTKKYEVVPEVTEDVTESFSATKYAIPDFSVDFDELLATNSDCVAWLYIPSVEISYPVCQSHDNAEYLKKTFNGGKNASGCIFTDYRVTTPFKQKTIVYGHNMKNGTMFAGLYAFEDMEDTSNVEIWVYLKDGTIQKYQITSVRRVIDTDAEVYSIDGDTTTIVLSTCVQGHERLVIIAQKVATYI